MAYSFEYRQYSCTIYATEVYLFFSILHTMIQFFKSFLPSFMVGDQDSGSANQHENCDKIQIVIDSPKKLALNDAAPRLGLDLIQLRLITLTVRLTKKPFNWENWKYYPVEDHETWVCAIKKGSTLKCSNAKLFSFDANNFQIKEECVETSDLRAKKKELQTYLFNKERRNCVVSNKLLISKSYDYENSNSIMKLSYFKIYPLSP